MGRTHLITGAAGYLGIVAPVLASHGVPTTPGTLACGAVVAGGAAMLPDLDHPSATAARAFGPVSWSASRIIARVAGGHRVGTHSLLALLLVAFGTGWLLSGPALNNRWVAFALCFVCVALFMRIVLADQSDLVSVIASLALTWLLLLATPDFQWLGWAITVGYGMHIVCDWVTEQGVALLWPLSRGQWKLGLVRTDGALEKLIAVSCLLLLVVLCWTRIASPALASGVNTQVSAAQDATPHAAAPSPNATAGGNREAAPTRTTPEPRAAAARERVEDAWRRVDVSWNRALLGPFSH